MKKVYLHNNIVFNIDLTVGKRIYDGVIFLTESIYSKLLKFELNRKTCLTFTASVSANQPHAAEHNK